MRRREVMAFVLGAATALTAALGIASWDGRLIGVARAQDESMSSRQQYLLVLAIGNALSSLAVDSERTATGLNGVADRVMALEMRLRRAEKRIEDLERPR